MRAVFVFCAAVEFIPLVGLADDVQWGHLRGRFVYGASHPVPKRLAVWKDVDALGDSIEDELAG